MPSQPDVVPALASLPLPRTRTGDCPPSAVPSAMVDRAFDLWLRDAVTAYLVQRMLAGVPPTLRILEVNGHDRTLAHLLDPQLTHVTRFSALGPGTPVLPLADESFDAVVALSAFDELNPEQRQTFLADCVRVARHGAILAVERAQSAEREGPGADAELTELLRGLDCPFSAFDQEALEDWLSVNLLAADLRQRHAPSEVFARSRRLAGQRSAAAPLGRRLYVCAKTFDATAALEPLVQHWAGPLVLPASAARLQRLAEVAGQAIRLVTADLDAQIAELAAVRRRHCLELTALHAAYRSQLGSLEERLRTEEAERRDCLQRQVVLSSFVESLSGSRIWKLAAPLRGLRRLLGAGGFDHQALLPWQQLEPDPDAEPGTWRATGADPQFLVPCVLPPGWLRLRLRMRSDVPARLTLSVCSTREGDWHSETVVRAEVSGVVDREFVFPLSRPGLALRFGPLDAPGTFRLEQFQLTPLPWPAGLLRSWRNEPRGSFTCEPEARACPRRAGKPNYAASVLPMRATTPDLDEYPDLQLNDPPTVDWSVVIPTVNDVHRVVQCVASCRLFLPSNSSTEFLVVDDGTRDPALLRQLRQAAVDHQFELLCNHQNLGFSATVNHGLRHSRGRFVLLCNNDIVFDRPWQEVLDREFTANPAVGIIGARLLYPDGTIQHAGLDKTAGELSWLHTHAGAPADHPPANQGRSIWAVTGALLAVRRETLRRLGGLSTAYAAGYEDLDYCLHAWANGVRVAYCPEAAAYHVEGGTRGATADEMSRRPLWWAQRNQAGHAYFSQKWATIQFLEDFEALGVPLTVSDAS